LKDMRRKAFVMMAMTKRPDINQPSINQEAERWLAGLFSGDRRKNADAELADWKAQSREHERAFDELVAITDELDTVAEQALAEEMVRELEAASVERRRQRWIAGISSVAASLVVASVLTVSMWVSGPDPVTYETMKGERSTIALEDGSTLQLNTGTRVVATLGGDTRRVTVEQGEAFFDVKRDEDRPFLVDAGDTRVKVLGTKFNVRLGASTNVVSVLSGLVSVSHRSDRDGEDTREIALLQAGERALHDPGTRSAVVGAFDQSAAMAWRTGKAVYHELPLADVVADLNRYFDAPLEIADEDLAGLPVTGTFNLTDQDVVIDALESAFSLMAVKRIDGVVLLYARRTG
jgi:transmembrane sensor